MLQGDHVRRAISVPTVIATSTAEDLLQTVWTAQTQGPESKTKGEIPQRQAELAGEAKSCLVSRTGSFTGVESLGKGQFVWAPALKRGHETSYTLVSQLLPDTVLQNHQSCLTQDKGKL